MSDFVDEGKLPSVVDLFSGCGGMSLGFQTAGFQVLAGFDNWECAVKTYSENLGHRAYELDLSDVDETIERLAVFRQDDGSFPAIIGGPPCQDFSSAGMRIEGERADLTEKFAAVVAEFRPPFFVMENVPRAEKADAYRRALTILEGADYIVEKKVLNAVYCGVPQRRRRLITFGSLAEGTPPKVKHYWDTKVSKTPMTVKQWFDENIGIGSLDTKYYYRHPRSYERRAIFSVNEPSPTIRGMNRPIPGTYKLHPGDKGPVEETRPLDTRERALIQTFPADFKFLGTKTENEQMIGNAVPVQLGKFIGESIKSALNGEGPKTLFEPVQVESQSV